MKTLKIFYLDGCPYCRRAREAVRELTAKHLEYAKAAIEWIEESRFPEIADKYDYYRVPSVFWGEEKLYECSPSDDADEIKRQMERALQIAVEP